MSALVIEKLHSKSSNEASYLLINKAAGSAAIVNPTSQLSHLSLPSNISLDWVLLTHLPEDTSVLSQLGLQFDCVIASSNRVIQQLPSSLSAECEVLENHEISMLGHIELEALISGSYINYQIAEHLFACNEQSIDNSFLAKLLKQSNNSLIHLFQFNHKTTGLNHEVSLIEFKNLITRRDRAIL